MRLDFNDGIYAYIISKVRIRRIEFFKGEKESIRKIYLFYAMLR